MGNLPQSVSVCNRYWLAAIVCLALVVRLTAAYLQPNYIDEGFNYYLCRAGIGSMIDAVKSDVHTPAAQLAVYPLTLLTHDIFLLRLPFVLAGTLSVVLSFYIFLYYVSERDALLLSLFLAVSYSLWNTDVLMRPYGPLHFFLTAVWLGILSCREHGCPYASSGQNKPARLRWALFALACLGAACFHLIGILVLAACAGCVVFAGGSRRRTVLLIIALSVVPSLLWFCWGPMRVKMSGGGQAAHAFSIPATAANIPASILNIEALRGLLIGRQELWAEFLQAHIVSAITGLGGAALLICLYGAYVMMRRDAWKACLALLNLVFPLAVLITAAKLGLMEMFYLRYALPLTVPFMCLLFCGCGDKAGKACHVVILSAAAVLCLCFPFRTQLWNQYWAGTFDFIEQRQRSYDVIFVNISYAVYSFSMAYNCENIDFSFTGNQAACRQIVSAGKLPVYALSPKNCSPSMVEGLGPMRIFLVLCESGYEDDYVLKWLLRYYRIADGMEYTNLHYWGSVRTVLLERRTADDN